ncbi:hypothetical protein AB3464_00500 [Pseudomonas asplenii]|uniref:hypothetical protein n=1 Tax=Pseudomonas asplenii TaxID=53407 RepID=UPI0037C616BE
MPIDIRGGLGGASVQSISGPPLERARCDVTLLGRSLETVRNTQTYSSILQRAPRPVSVVTPSSLKAAPCVDGAVANRLQGAANVAGNQVIEPSSSIKPPVFNGLLGGFANTSAFCRFGVSVREGLSSAGYDNVEPILQGSAVTGKNFRTGQAFDVRRISDFDVALAGPTILEKAESLGIGLRSGGRRTGPLAARDLKRLGLNGLADRLSRQAGREVNFMIFGSVALATSRAPSVILPK